MLKNWMDRNQVATAEAGRPMVLVVDDDRNFCEAIARCLAQRGYDVTCADGGELAVEAIGERKPDVIVTDVMMPGMDGIDLMNWLREEGLDIPVIVISGDGQSADGRAKGPRRDTGALRTTQGIDLGAGEKASGTQSALLAVNPGATTRETVTWMGATSVLQKPFGRALLEDSVARALKSQVTVH
jgi:CheY-like chemotaxis protein